MPKVREDDRKRPRRIWGLPEFLRIEREEPVDARSRAVAALEASAGDVSRAAERLGIPEATMRLVVGRMGLRPLGAELKARAWTRFRLTGGMTEK